MRSKQPEEATLLDILVDGFDKNEVMHGFHWRDLPLPDERAAQEKFDALTAEATRWKGTADRTEHRADRRLASWGDLEIRQAGRGVMVRIRAPHFGAWWHASSTWDGDPMGILFEWLAEQASR